MDHRASCICGQLSLLYKGEITRTSMCHCQDCQRRTGSVFGVHTRIARDQVTVSGNSTTYERTADSGGKSTLHFCPNCGSTVYLFAHENPDLLVVPVGTFADASLPAPVYSVYEVRRHPWVHVPDSVTERWD